jgi:hypothetical protein
VICEIIRRGHLRGIASGMCFALRRRMNSSTLGLTSLVFAALVACGGAPAQAAPPAHETHAASVAGPWEKLGERTVNGKFDRDTIHVGKHDGRFTAMQIKVDGDMVEMFEIVVTFGDGEKWAPETRLVFDKNTKSRVIDLPGGRRVIEKVEFKYGKLPGEGKAMVELWGRQA